MKRGREGGSVENSHGCGGKSGTEFKLESRRGITCTCFEGCDIHT
jgi:hypothetical protein